MYADFHLDRAEAHRVAQMELGWPLLRGCPSMSAKEAVRYLDSLSREQQAELIREFGAFDRDILAKPPVTMDEEQARLMQGYPAFAAYRAIVQGPPRASNPANLPIKIRRGLGHDVSPVRPAKLRKLIAQRLTEAFGVTERKVDTGMTQYRSDDFVINFFWASSGSQMMKQFDYSHQVRRPEGGMTRPLSYGGVMRVAGCWDAISESSVEQDVEHLVRLIEACRQLV